MPKVNYSFGFPTSITPGGIEMDLDTITIAAADTNATKEGRKQIVQQAGMISSALEHAIPEQMFVNAANPGEAISAVKAISKAAQAGQRIYTINQANMATVLPNINHSSFVMGEITTALNAGYEVITHTDAVSVPGWSGAGYIILDPETGDGVYKIESGSNGAGLFFGLIIGTAISLFIFSLVAFPALFANPLTGGLMVAALGAMLLFAVIWFSVFNSLVADENFSKCFNTGLFAGLSAGLTLLSFGYASILKGKIVAIFAIVGLTVTIADAEIPQNRLSECY